MSMISMAVYDTDDNKRTDFTEQTLISLKNRVDFSKHRLIISDNGSCDLTHKLYSDYKSIISQVIENGSNLGTAGAINKAWQLRNPGEFCIKMDNDVVIHQDNWIEDMEYVFDKDKSVGVVGLKRKDLGEWPLRTDIWQSKIIPLAHESGERWMVIEEVNHLMGTCNMYSPHVLDKIGYLFQPTVYGFDDTFSSLRVKLVGYKNVFLIHINIDHIDSGDSEFSEWKRKHASEIWDEFEKIQAQYKLGERGAYYNGISYEQINENGIDYYISKKI